MSEQENLSLTLAEKLKKYRENCGLTQDQVADALPITRSAYASYEIGRATPRFSVIRLLSKIFNVEIAALLPEEKKPSFKVSDTEPLPPIKPIYQLKKDEQRLLVKYRVLGAEEKEDLSNYLNKLLADANRKDL